MQYIFFAFFRNVHLTFRFILSFFKNFWKFNFHRGHRLHAKDNYGQEYSEKWDKLNLSAANTLTGGNGLVESGTFVAIPMMIKYL